MGPGVDLPWYAPALVRQGWSGQGFPGAGPGEFLMLARAQMKAPYITTALIASLFPPPSPWQTPINS